MTAIGWRFAAASGDQPAGQRVGDRDRRRDRGRRRLGAVGVGETVGVGEVVGSPETSTRTARAVATAAPLPRRLRAGRRVAGDDGAAHHDDQRDGPDAQRQRTIHRRHDLGPLANPGRAPSGGCVAPQDTGGARRSASGACMRCDDAAVARYAGPERRRARGSAASHRTIEGPHGRHRSRDPEPPKPTAKPARRPAARSPAARRRPRRPPRPPRSAAPAPVMAPAAGPARRDHARSIGVEIVRGRRPRPRPPSVVSITQGGARDVQARIRARSPRAACAT